jgi:hypothetical protein
MRNETPKRPERRHLGPAALLFLAAVLLPAAAVLGALPATPDAGLPSAVTADDRGPHGAGPMLGSGERDSAWQPGRELRSGPGAATRHATANLWDTDRTRVSSVVAATSVVTRKRIAKRKRGSAEQA